jgi:glycopeptide antibiotics resistance protein
VIDKAFESVVVGGLVSLVCFIPYLVYQYRRYGRFSAARLIWSFLFLVYVTAVVSYTIFPLPTPEVCAESTGGFVIDPWLYFRDIWADHLAGQSWWAIARSWTVLQMVLNVVLLMPLGVIVRHLWKAGVIRTTLIGLAVSLLIEATQLTGNWFTAPCRYRVADVNDLMTNTLGAFLGGLLALAIPRFTPSADDLVATRGFAKPVHRGRRWVGMLFDLIALMIVFTVVEVALNLWYNAIVPRAGDSSGFAAFTSFSLMVAQVACLVLVLVFSLVGSGASVGQRLVYLKPAPRRSGRRFWLLVRAVSVQGLLLALLFWIPHGGWFALVWFLTAVIWGLVSPRGLSFTLAGCEIVDSRPPQPFDLSGEGPIQQSSLGSEFSPPVHHAQGNGEHGPMLVVGQLEGEGTVEEVT